MPPAATDFIEFLTPAGLSKLPLVDDLSSVDVFVIGYNPAGEGQMVRVALDALLAGSVDATVTSLAGFAAVPALPLPVGTVKVWVNAADMTIQVWVLKTSTAATVSGSVQRPSDYAATTNEKVWFRAG